MAKQTINIAGMDHTIIGTEYKSTAALAKDKIPEFEFFRGTETGNNKKYVQTDNPYPQGGIIYAIQFRVYGPAFVPVDYSAPTHTYATLSDLAKFLHFAEVSLKYGDDDQFEKRKLENIIPIPELAKPFLSGGSISSGSAAPVNLVYRDRAQIYAAPNGSTAVDGLMVVGQGGRGLAVDDKTSISLKMTRQDNSDYVVPTNLNGHLVTATFIGPRFATSGVTRGS